MKELNTMEKIDIERYAKNAVARINYNGEMVDIVEIVKKYGFKILTAKMADNTDGFIIVNPGNKMLFHIPGEKFIGFNSEKTIQEKRFIIAHELGHYLLHYQAANKDGEMFAMREHIKGKDNNEQDVDYFAACVLMPKEEFSKKYHMLKRKKESRQEIVKELAKIFVVEEESVDRRIEEICGNV